MKLNRTFTISLCLNLALAGAAVHHLKKIASSMPRTGAPTISETTIAPAVTSLPGVGSISPESVTSVTNRFAWSRVEAEDFEQLATNLRAIGCPEKTVCDVVVARARRSLQHVSTVADPKLPFWTAGIRRERANRTAQLRSRLSQEEIVARLEQVVGRDVFLEDTKMMDDFEEQAVMRFVIGPMPDETFFKVAAKLAWFGVRNDDLNSRSGGVWLDADEAEVGQLRARYWGELAALLTPAQWEEMTARGAMMPLADQVCFEATDLSLTEVRQLALLRAQFSDPVSDEWLNGSSLTDEQEEKLKAAERQFLGKARFAQLERAKDGDFKTLFELGLENNLPRDSAVKVFEIRKLTADEVRQLREDRSLSDAERKQRLAQMEAETQRAVLQVLGAKACGQYLGGGGAWLTNAIGL